MRSHDGVPVNTIIAMIVSLCMLVATNVSADVPGLINLQGKLTDATNNPLPDASYSVTFRIYDNAGPGGTILWLEASSVTTADGLFTTNLGAVTPIPDSVFNNPDRWLGIQVQGFAEMFPRSRLTSVAYANNSAQWTSTGQNISRSNGYVGIGTTAPFSRMHITSAASDLPPRLQSSGTTGYAAGWDFYHGTTGKGYVGVSDLSAGGPGPGEMLLYGSPGTQTSLWAGGVRSVTLGTVGNVGIGTTPSSSRQLNVASGLLAAVEAISTASNGYGVMGRADNGSDAYGIYGASVSGYAGTFVGKVQVVGTLTKNAGSFKIDHPLDPANKYLSHSFVESPDMKNIYDGIASLDSKGEATIALPDWFGALNKDFRYQLTAIGAPGPGLYIAQEITGNHFRIAGGSSGMKVSWQVTGIRQDAYANAHRIPVEEAKPEKERGFYFHPELFSQPEEQQLEWARRPEMMKQMKDDREKAKAEEQ